MGARWPAPRDRSLLPWLPTPLAPTPPLATHLPLAGRAEYLQFLVDSRHVYQCLEDVVASNEELASFGDSGLERAAALEKDVAWFSSEGLETPPLGPHGKEYAARLREIADAGQWEVFTCHFYNFMFAHTAGGRMIGKMMSDKLLEVRLADRP